MKLRRCVQYASNKHTSGRNGSACLWDGFWPQRASEIVKCIWGLFGDVVHYSMSLGLGSV